MGESGRRRGCADARIGAGCPHFRAFFEDDHRPLFKTLYFVTGDAQEAADLMQEFFLKVWERWDRVDHMGRTPWRTCSVRR